MENPLFTSRTMGKEDGEEGEEEREADLACGSQRCC